MSDTTKNFLFAHRGMNQSDRLEQVPDPDAMKVSGRSFEELVGRSAEFARSLAFYGDNNKPDGSDWSDFFKDVYDYETHTVRTDILEDWAQNATTPPHLSLLFAFFRMLLVTQGDMNKLTDRQLDFYLRDILGFRTRKGTEGHVTVFAELGRNVNSVSIEKGLLFDAGKDADGKPVTYEAVDELLLGKDEVVDVVRFSFWNGFDRKPTSSKGVSNGESAGSQAGTGTAAGTGDKTHALCIAAEVLNVPGCDMTISFPNCQTTVDNALKEIRAEYTSVDGWTPFNGSLHIEQKMPAIACYDPKLHGKGIETEFPVIRFVSDNGSSSLSALQSADLKEVSVTIKDYIPRQLENKYGKVENLAGTNPFGPDGLQDDFVDIVLPFEDANAQYEFILNDSSIAEKADSLDKLRIRYKIIDNSCDQASLSKLYSDFVLKAFLTENDSDRNAAMSTLSSMTLHAVLPKLCSPVKITSASGKGKVSTVLMQTPCGTEVLMVNGVRTTSGYGFASIVMIFLMELAHLIVSMIDRSALPAETLEQLNKTALYISLSQPGRGQISLYLENTGKAEGPGSVQWSYRKGSDWVEFSQSAILKDTTFGLSQSGIVVFDCKEPLPEGEKGFMDGLPCIQAICSNENCLHVKEVRSRAIELAYSASSAGIGPGGAPLPKETISKAVYSVVGVKAFSQPYDGEPGTRAEDPVRFRRRVAERLRHKGRAWSTWDYETLVLESFADVSYVKCLPSCLPDGTPAPGHVSVLIIPDSPDDPLKPAPRIKLVNDVTKLLLERTSSFAQLHVIGPSFKEVTVEATIALRPGYHDTTRYDALVTDALTDYLRPWVGYKTGWRFKDGDGASDIIAFLESLPFVDIIEDLKVTVGGEAVNLDGRIERGSAVEALTSAPAHRIKCHTAD
ncbi:MAG: baseplate J/gp47 family protein [Bacteroidales bacterium]|nr:baseplate J/gp47 family protein [Bacteroidales bacterium]